MSTKHVLIALGLGSIVACGGGPQIKAGPMPKGASFYGVWQSPQYGSMHICQSGREIIGDYAKHERSGRIQGKVDGDLLTFQWEDTRELVKGKPMERRGRGYFRIEVGDDGDQYIRGEWGFGEDETGGGPWNAVKLRRGQPDRCIGEDDEALATQDEQPHPWDVEDASDQP